MLGPLPPGNGPFFAGGQLGISGRNWVSFGGMNNAQQKTLEAVFKDPVNGNFDWRKLESLLLALGAKKIEGNGSAVSFFLNGARADFHRPHPDRAALRYRVKAARKFLENAGVKP
jgi:HicA toxin of bacterial toxin-antitoxin,